MTIDNSRPNHENSQNHLAQGMRTFIIICALVLFFSPPLDAQDRGVQEGEREEKIVDPPKKKSGPMDLLGGKSAETKKEKTPGDTRADTMSERVAEDEREQKEKDLDYLDEDQDD